MRLSSKGRYAVMAMADLARHSVDANVRAVALADIAARTVQSPGEIPIGVVTACVGAPFFLFVLRSRRAREQLS